MQGLARRITSVVRGALAVAAFAALGLTITAVGPAGLAAAKGSNAPPGNNGTVKIDGIPIDPGHDNDPHLDCNGLSVEFFGYDGGQQSATITLIPWAPTRGGRPYQASTGWNVGTRTSGSQFDTSVPITWSDLVANGTFTGVSPQAQQGYHLKLEVEVTGSQGSDDKYKVFWIGPCSSGGGQARQTSSTTSSTSTSTTTTTVAGHKGESPMAPTTVQVTGGASSGSTTGGVSLGAGHSSGIPAAVPSAAAPQGGSNLAFTGFDTIGATAAGAALIGGGLLLVRRWRSGRRPA